MRNIHIELDLNVESCIMYSNQVIKDIGIYKDSVFGYQFFCDLDSILYKIFKGVEMLDYWYSVKHNTYRVRYGGIKYTISSHDPRIILR